MKISPTPKMIWISLLINVLICWFLLPYVLQPSPIITTIKLLEIIFWHGLGLISWPVVLIMALVNLLFSSTLPQLRDLFIVILFPIIEINLLLLFISKKNKWIPLILVHIFLLTSYIFLWLGVMKGYNFMVG